MSAASNRPPRWISESDAAEVEAHVAALEERWPLEVRVVVSTRGGRYPLGGVRLLAAAVVLVEALTWGLWLAVPVWGFHLLILALLFFAGEAFGALPLARLFTTRRERELDVERRAHTAFARNEVGLTPHRNGVLLYYSLPERMFYLVPDTPLVRLFPSDDWQRAVDRLREALAKAPAEKRLRAGIDSLLKDLEAKAAKRLVPRARDEGDNALPNHIVFE